MNIKRCIPLLVFVILLAAAAVQGLRRQAAQPELLQSQVTAAENSLETVESLELEIELRAPEELEMSYSSGGRAFSTRGADPEEAVRLFVEALPHLEEGRPLAIIQAALEHLDLDELEVKEFELEYELKDGYARRIELEVDGDPAEDDDD
ncbi:MAG: hypothetical protein WBI99_06650 [Limnochordia bacterium]|jgi:hypothetical protein|nr:hypothetical protein [Bacillota bacterium]HOB40949.1 hypothetical protein [Limnochordia bacterium]NLO94617.1 hypothetical protein [Bacillota bacterium]HOK31997.1 hypothetical protein [Limnochordia bacterium]HOM00839.1 hypothetical protein [Limnochordia bacterium]